MKNLTLLTILMSLLVGCDKDEKDSVVDPTSTYYGNYTGDLHFKGASYYRQDSLGNWTNNPYDYHINPGEVELKQTIWNPNLAMLYFKDKNDSLVPFYDSAFQLDKNGEFYDTLHGGSSYRHTYILVKGDSLIASRYRRFGLGGGFQEIKIKSKK